jgi:FPC/CPF motif-containing protein YcgG
MRSPYNKYTVRQGDNPGMFEQGDLSQIANECTRWDENVTHYLREHVNDLAVAKFTHPKAASMENPEFNRFASPLVKIQLAKNAALENIAESITNFVKTPSSTGETSASEP